MPEGGTVGGPGRVEGPEGAGGPGKGPRARRARRGAFGDALSREVSSKRADGAAESGRVQAAVESQEGLKADDVKLLRRYSALERDAALYEVRTPKGPFHVVVGRDGSLTVFKA